MPTPFEHLVYAERVLGDSRLPAALRQTLTQDRGAFLLGNTAGDIQSVTGQSRVETHFYRLSALGKPPACEALFTAFPELTNPRRLSLSRSVFLSGYLVHLIFDEVWAREVFIPFYQDATRWMDRLSSSIQHNALRVYLDHQAQRALLQRPHLLDCLRHVRPRHWLPFADDEALCHWRDWLVAQLTEPQNAETSQVLAARMGITPAELDAVVRGIEEGTEGLDAGLLERLTLYEQRALAESVTMLSCYWGTEIPSHVCPAILRVPRLSTAFPG